MNQKEKIRKNVLTMIERSVDRMKSQDISGHVSLESLDQWCVFLHAMVDDILAGSMDVRGEEAYTQKVILEKVRDLAAASVKCLEENL